MLTNVAVRAARPRPRAYKMFDERGLHLHVAPTGRLTWRVKYRLGGREQLLTIGCFPDVSLNEARAQCEAAHASLLRGEKPCRPAALAAEAFSFEDAARAWHDHQRERWTAVHAQDVLASFERDVFAAIGAMPLAAIASPDILKLLRRVEARGCLETARRLRQRLSGVFALAISEGWTDTDPAAIVARALKPPKPARHQLALLELDDARALLAASERTPAHRTVRLASAFLALTAVRLATLRGARWDEFEDIDWTGTFVGPQRPLWRVPAARMKLARDKKLDAANDHIVPLSPPAVAILRAARAAAGGSALVFPGRADNRPIGERAIGDLYLRAGYAGRHVPHGWRATFSTLLNRRFRGEGDRGAIDRALAHAIKDKVEAAYNRDEDIDRRRVLFVTWGSMLAC